MEIKIVLVQKLYFQKNNPQFLNIMHEAKKCLILNLLKKIVNLLLDSFFIKKRFFESGGLAL